ncbi:MAG: SGNH/GDSL hydrolase family protein, partial [Spirochaetales bacterium]|nr:SGNH/GDSL hydrolase family protein [Spirochaetales bacterium]
ISFAALVLVGAITGVTLIYAQRQATRLPADSPSAFVDSRKDNPHRAVIVLVGDSLTHGAVTANYVEALAAKLNSVSPGMYQLVNAGINSELSYNVTTRLDDVIRCAPDFVVVLIGTNDANAQISQENMDRYIHEQELPQAPDAEGYRENLRLIAGRLKIETEAEIAFLSLPTMGEDAESRAYRLSEEYSRIIKDTCGEYDVSYLQLFETMDSYLRLHPGRAKHEYSKTRALMMRGVLKRYVLGQSWNRIGASNGFSLHTDHLHLNETGADMVAELVLDFIRRH